MFTKTALALAMLSSFAAPLSAETRRNFSGSYDTRATVTYSRPYRQPDAKIIAIPQPATEAERADAAERDRAWVERCQPRIVQAANAWEPDYYVYGNAACGRTR